MNVLNFIIVIVGILCIAGAIVPTIFTKMTGKKNTGTGKSKTRNTVFIAVGIVLFIGGMSFTIIPTGYTGVRTTFGQISQETVPQGFNLKIPFVQDINLVNNKQQDKFIEAQVWGESSEKTPVYASEITVTYQINDDASAWIFANVTNTDNLINDTLVASAAKSAMVELPSNEVTVRSKIEPLVKEKLTESITEKYGENKISVLKVVVNQMDFEEAYNNAIAEKSIAQQAQEKQKIENETAIAKAEADKKVAIANAEAKSEALRIQAEAEANANKLLRESLTDEILKSKFYEKWNGELPQAMGSDTVITNIAGESTNSKE